MWSWGDTGPENCEMTRAGFGSHRGPSCCLACEKQTVGLIKLCRSRSARCRRGRRPCCVSRLHTAVPARLGPPLHTQHNERAVNALSSDLKQLCHCDSIRVTVKDSGPFGLQAVSRASVTTTIKHQHLKVHSWKMKLKAIFYLIYFTTTVP